MALTPEFSDDSDFLRRTPRNVFGTAKHCSDADHTIHKSCRWTGSHSNYAWLSVQVGSHSQRAERIEDGENFVSRDLGNYRVFESDDPVAAWGKNELKFELGGRKRCLLMFKLLIRDSRVDAGTPR